uniref:Putative p43 protein n=1 Tax=Strawberry associated virus A TaxID=2684439 RepID=A0A7S5GI41_9TOMB|nr:putative p43 protein [Strawberry associated virus A]
MANKRRRSARSKRRRKSTLSNIEHFSVHSAPSVPVNVGQNTCACLLLPLTHKWVTELVASAPYKGGRFKTLSTTVDVVGPTAKSEIYVGIIRTPPDTVKPMGKENDWSMIIRLWRDCYVRRKSTGSSGLACNFNLSTPWMTDDSNEDLTASVFIGWYNDGITNSRASVDMRVRLACIPNRLWPEGAVGKGHMRNKRGLEERDLDTIEENKLPEDRPERKENTDIRDIQLITTQEDADYAYVKYGPRSPKWVNRIPRVYWRREEFGRLGWRDVRNIAISLGMPRNLIDMEKNMIKPRIAWLINEGCPEENITPDGWCSTVWTAFGFSTWQQPLEGGEPIPLGLGSTEAPETSEFEIGMSRLEITDGEMGGEIIPHQ